MFLITPGANTPLSTDCGVEDLFEQINSALVTFGVQLILE